MAKIDKAIEFMNDNYIMINSIRCSEDDKDVVEYIVKQLNIRKKEIEKELSGAVTPKELQLINISR